MFLIAKKSPRWENRFLVGVQVTTDGRNAGIVKVTPTRTINPTLAWVRLRRGKA